ncbi:hypothetical protein [Nonomuraea sp. NPDC049684]|uniref:hypothetical protein n=1 Tax=Nonomuraea sp. NPDC049684 TaxID=3364356 RepID=UPI0037B0E5BC
MSSEHLWRFIRIGLVSLILLAAVAVLVLGDTWLWVAAEWSPPTFGELYTDDGRGDGSDASAGLALFGAALLGGGFGGGLAMVILVDAVRLVSTVWIAATARELAAGGRPADLPPVRRRGARVAVAAVVSLVVLINPEQNARLTYTAGSAGCYDRPSFGDVKPAERDTWRGGRR